MDRTDIAARDQVVVYDLLRLDSSPDTPASCRTVVYVTNTSHDGNFGGRSGLDAFCAASKPSALSCVAVHALLNVDGGDLVGTMPQLYGYEGNAPLCWYEPVWGFATKFANTWADMLDGTIEVDRRTGTGRDTYVWTGTVDPLGSAVDSTRYHCTNWTVAGNAGAAGNHWNFNFWEYANTGSGGVAMPDVTTNWLATASTFQKKKWYGPTTCCAYNEWACPTACPPDTLVSMDTLVCGGHAYLMCACAR